MPPTRRTRRTVVPDEQSDDSDAEARDAAANIRSFFADAEVDAGGAGARREEEEESVSKYAVGAEFMLWKKLGALRRLRRRRP